MGLPITASCDTAWIQTSVSVVMPLALRFSALDRCATREPIEATLIGTAMFLSNQQNPIHFLSFRTNIIYSMCERQTQFDWFSQYTEIEIVSSCLVVSQLTRNVNETFVTLPLSLPEVLNGIARLGHYRTFITFLISIIEVINIMSLFRHHGTIK